MKSLILVKAKSLQVLVQCSNGAQLLAEEGKANWLLSSQIICKEEKVNSLKVNLLLEVEDCGQPQTNKYSLYLKNAKIIVIFIMFRVLRESCNWC